METRFTKPRLLRKVECRHGRELSASHKSETERGYRARFAFDPNGIYLNSGNHTLFQGLLSPAQPLFTLDLGKDPDEANYQLQVGVYNDLGALILSPGFGITDDPHLVEMAWGAATGPGTEGGWLRLWVDGMEQYDLTGVDNDTHRLEYIQLGAVKDPSPETLGSYCLDAFESWREGLRSGSPAPRGRLGECALAGAQKSIPRGERGRGTNLSPYTLYLPYLTRSGGLPSPLDNRKSTIENRASSLRTNHSLMGISTVVITYSYDPLSRLTAAEYSDGTAFQYAYDAVGNRLVLTTTITTTQVVTYTYDDANRLTSVGGTPYTWDANGNLLSDGISVYTYTHANRLAAVSGQSSAFGFQYNGLGDRLSQTADGMTTNYTIDLATGLTQVLADGTNTYLYGLARIGEEQPGGWAYHLPDALGSVRQLTDAAGMVTLARSYEPYGDVLSSDGTGTSSYAFVGEWQDATGLLHLRARYYEPGLGRLITRDVWSGDPNRPMSHNAWLYALANPINHIDPTGQCGIAIFEGDLNDQCWDALHATENEFPYIDLQTDVNIFTGRVWTLEEINLIRRGLAKLRLKPTSGEAVLN
jgi:RHS repeat-associated protein